MFPLTAGIAASVAFFSVSCLVFGVFLLPSALRSMPPSVVKDVVKRGEHQQKYTFSQITILGHSEDEEDDSNELGPSSSLRTRRRSSRSVRVEASGSWACHLLLM